MGTFFVDNNSGNLYNLQMNKGVFYAVLKINTCSGLKRGEMMRNVSVFVCNGILVVALLVLVFMPFGCSSFSQPGETAADGNRRHHRTASINQQVMMSDIDATLMYDRPSRLTDKRIP